MPDSNLIFSENRSNNILSTPEQIAVFREKMAIACAQFCKAWDCIDQEIKSDRNFILGVVQNNFNQLPYCIDPVSRNALELYFLSKIKEILDHIDPDLKKNEEFVLQALTTNPSMLLCAADEYKKSRDFLRKALKQNSMVIIFADPEWQNDQSFLLEMIEENSNIFDHISPKLKSNKDFSFKALEKNAEVFLWIVDEEQRKNKTLVSKAIKKCARAIRNAADCLQEDEEFLLSLIQENPEVLCHIKDELYSSPFVLKAVSRNGLALQFVRGHLRWDPKIIEAAIRHNAEAKKYLLPHGNDSRSRLYVSDRKIKEETQSGKNPSSVRFMLIGFMALTGIKLLFVWALGYFQLSLSVLIPIYCVGMLIMYWRLTKKDADSHPHTIKNGSVSDSSSQKSTANGIIPQPSAQIFSSEKSAAEPAPLSSPSPGPCPGHAS